MNYAAAVNSKEINTFFTEPQNMRTPFQRAQDFAERLRSKGHTVVIFQERQGTRFVKNGKDVFPRWIKTSI